MNSTNDKTGVTSSTFVTTFLTFIKLVSAPKVEEPTFLKVSKDILDTMTTYDSNVYLCSCDETKIATLHAYIFLYIAVYGELPNFGSVGLAMYVSDTVEDGVADMRQNLERICRNSEFLQKYLPHREFTNTKWEFQNSNGGWLCIHGYGVSTGVKGVKVRGERPTLCIMNGLLSDNNSKIPFVTALVNTIVYESIRQMLHPYQQKVFWAGTPFNVKDPLTTVSPKSWNIVVCPACETNKCTEEF